jgi:hypothetical protein
MSHESASSDLFASNGEIIPIIIDKTIIIGYNRTVVIPLNEKEGCSMFPYLRNASIVVVILLTLTACGGGGTPPANNSGIKGIAVDPYIVSAVFCEDKNNNGVCDPGEQVSTVSDISGVFYFSNALTLGSDIIVKTQGTHNGVLYTGDIKRKVDQADNLVISPLTTLLANGWTEQNVIDVLQHSNSITSLTAADLKKDPLAGIETLDAASLTADHFKIVKSTISIHSFLSIMKSVLTGTGGGYNITYAVFSSPTASINGQTPQWYVDRMVDRITEGLDPAILTSIASQRTMAATICASVPPIAGGPLPPPPVATAGDMIRGSVAIADYVISKVTSSLTYAPTLADYGPWRQQLGLRFYLIRTKNDPCVSAGITNNAFNTALGEPFNPAWTSCKISTGPTRTGEAVCF